MLQTLVDVTAEDNKSGDFVEEIEELMFPSCDSSSLVDEIDSGDAEDDDSLLPCMTIGKRIELVKMEKNETRNEIRDL